MDRYLGKYSELIFSVVRIVVGLLFAQHGAQKLFGLLGGVGESGGTAAVGSLFFFAGLIEFFGGLLIAAGLLGSWVAFLASGEMAVAYFRVHAPRAFWPIQNGGELAILYCFAFLFIAVHGSGRWSVDAVLRKSKPAG